MATKAPKTAEARLTDLDVREVSVVDRPANKRRFLIVKRDGGGLAVIRTEESMSRRAIPREAAEDFGHVLMDDDNDLTSRTAILKDEDLDDLLSLSEGESEETDEEEDEPELEQIEKGAVAEVIKIAKAAIAKLMAVVTAMKGAKKDAEPDKKVLAAVSKIANAIAAVAERLGSSDDKGKGKESEAEGGETEKAAGDVLAACNTAVATLTKVVNKLKTLGPDDEVPGDVASALQTVAGALSEAAGGDSAGGGGGGGEEQASDEKEKAADVDPKDDPKKGKKGKKPQPPGTEQVESHKTAAKPEVFKRDGDDSDDPEIIIKVGTKMKRTRLSLFEKAVQTLVEILQQLKGAEQLDEKGKKSRKEKADEDFQQKMLEGMTALKGEVGKVSKRVEELEGSRPAGTDEDPPAPVEKRKKGLWSNVLGT